MAKGNGQGMVMEDAWAALRAIEKQHTVLTQISMLVKTRRGVWGIRGRVYSVVDSKPHHCIVEVFEEWPNVRTMTLEALVFQLATSMVVRVEEAVELLKEQSRF
jgi:hypothetical protein